MMAQSKNWFIFIYSTDQKSKKEFTQSLMIVAIPKIEAVYVAIEFRHVTTLAKQQRKVDD